jgi:SRSO17 transposase
MKETTAAAMPPCFDRWCCRFDDVLTHQAQRREFRNYLAGLLGESERKNIFQMSSNAVGVTYHKLHHFLTEAPWSALEINERRLQVMASCRQTKIAAGFTLIVDDSGHRKSGTLTSGVGRQYIGEIGKTENGIVMVTTHLYDGVKSLPLDVELYQHASSLAQGKDDPEFVKKPDLAMNLIEKCLKRGHRPKIVLIDSGYGNNRHFVQQLEAKKLKYIVGVAKNRRVFLQSSSTQSKVKMRLDEVAKSLKPEAFTEITLSDEKPRTVWVATFSAQTIGLEGERVFAIVMNTPTLTEKTEVDYFMTNVSHSIATAQWFVQTYSQRNWVEVFYREAKGWLGLSEYQVREKKSLYRHWILVFTAYTFILWHQLTGGFRRRWANKDLTTFVDALSAFRTAVSFRFVEWLNHNRDVFAAYKASLGFIWA